MSKSNVQKKSSKRHSAEFKAGAVKMVTQQGLSQAQAARRLGVSATTLCHWVGQLAPNGQLTDPQMVARSRSLNRRTGG